MFHAAPTLLQQRSMPRHLGRSNAPPLEDTRQKFFKSFVEMGFMELFKILGDTVAKKQPTPVQDEKVKDIAEFCIFVQEQLTEELIDSESREQAALVLKAANDDETALDVDPDTQADSLKALAAFAQKTDDAAGCRILLRP